MGVLVVGSIALDTIETPYGKSVDCLGGSAVHFSLAAGLFTGVRLVGVVGRDFPEEHLEFLSARGVDIAGLEISGGKTFRWTGAYKGDMNNAETLAVELNVLDTFDPVIPGQYADTDYVFLANGSPRTQRSVRAQVPDAKMVVCDTMNFYIETEPGELKALLREVDGMVLNDAEAKMLTGFDRLVECGQSILDMGPAFVIIKKGEHGSLFVAEGAASALPAYPTAQVKDPTGAGDSFAGGFMGSLARSGDHSPSGLKEAMAYGTVVASLAVEGFGVAGLANVTGDELEARFGKYREMLRV